MEGIENLGGTCAINSLLQIIIRNNNLRTTILNLNSELNTFTQELKDIIEIIYNQNKSIRPEKFINYFFKTFEGIFNRYEEIDINELWLFIYNKIFDETSIKIISPKTIKNIYDKHNYDINIHNNNKINNLTRLVQGSYLNIIECSNCKNITYSFEPFISMSIDINENETIANLIMKSLNNEFREADDWKCDKCLKKCSYKKSKRIWKLPKVLFISVNRFKDIYNKNNLNININETLNFNIGSVETLNEDYIYKLQSLGLHYGKLTEGHYTALCNMNNGTYNFYNDNIIKIIKNEEVLEEIKNNNTSYMIVYESIK